MAHEPGVLRAAGLIVSAPSMVWLYVEVNAKGVEYDTDSITSADQQRACRDERRAV